VAYRYRPEVLDELLRHGVRPTAVTPPQFVALYLNDLYRFELRRLRARLLRGEVVRPEYAGHVIALRGKYPLLSLPVRLWVE
jgi:hypothetical protein